MTLKCRNQQKRGADFYLRTSFVCWIVQFWMLICSWISAREPASLPYPSRWHKESQPAALLRTPWAIPSTSVLPPSTFLGVSPAGLRAFAPVQKRLRSAPVHILNAPIHSDDSRPPDVFSWERSWTGWYGHTPPTGQRQRLSRHFQNRSRSIRTRSLRPESFPQAFRR